MGSRHRLQAIVDLPEQRVRLESRGFAILLHGRRHRLRRCSLAQPRRRPREGAGIRGGAARGADSTKVERAFPAQCIDRSSVKAHAGTIVRRAEPTP